MTTETIEELEERHNLLKAIEKLEQSTSEYWTDINELQERYDLLAAIKKHEEEDQWTPIEDLRERAELLEEIAKRENEESSSSTTTASMPCWRRSGSRGMRRGSRGSKQDD